MICFARVVLVTVKKLGWPPDIIHCHGWFTSLLPLYIKTAFKDNPLFSDSKVVYSIYNDVFDETLNTSMLKKLKYDRIKDSELKSYKKATYEGIVKGALDYADAIIVGSDTLEPIFEAYIQQLDKPTLKFQDGDTYIEAYNDFYNELLKDAGH